MKHSENLFTATADSAGSYLPDFCGGCAFFDLDESRLGLIASETRSGRNTGYAAVMGAVSRIVSRGGIARYALVSAGAAGSGEDSDIRELCSGADEASEAAGVKILGRSVFKVSVSQITITLHGEAEKKRLERISGPKPGDIIYITGLPGETSAGAELIASGDRKKEELFHSLAERHRRPTARFDIAPGVLDLFAPTAMTDISCGLALSLENLCRQHGCGFEIDPGRIPISPELREFSARSGKAAAGYALNGSGDLELLITTPRELTETMNVAVNNVPVTPIGRIIATGFHIAGKNRRESTGREDL